MKKIINGIIIFIVIALYVSVFLFIYTSFRERKRQEIADQIMNKVDKQIDANSKDSNPADEMSINNKGINYTVLGKIYIKKINFNMPILKENTANSYNTSVVKVSGPNLNTEGNVVIAGHNYMKSVFFMKINKLVKDNVITITDLSGDSVNYYVYDYGVTSADDASYMTQPKDDSKIVTLVTCTLGEERYYVKAKAR